MDTDRGGIVIGELAYRIGTLVGTGVGAIESRLPRGAASASGPADTGADDDPGAGPHTGPEPDSPFGDGEALVDTILSGAVGWAVKKLLRPRSVSWPRVVVAGIGATVLSDAVGRALEPALSDRDRAYEGDADALLIRLGAGVALAAGYAALLHPRLPGSPLVKGLMFGAMEIVAMPHGGLVRVATETPGLKFPLRDLAVPIDQNAGPLAGMTFGLALGILYRPSGDDG